MTRARVMLALAGLCCLLLIPLRSRAESAATPGAPAATPMVALGETPGAIPVSMLIHNGGAVGDRLLGGSTPLARTVEVHRSPLMHGVRAMVEAQEGLPIPGGSTVMLEPRNGHLMLIGLRASLVQGQTFPVTLRFARAGEVTVTARVRRKVDAAGVPPIPPVTAGDLTISLVSAPPAAAVAPATPVTARTPCPCREPDQENAIGR